MGTGEHVTQATLAYVNETWDQKMHRLALELAALRMATEYAAPEDRRWNQWGPRYRMLKYEIELHLRDVEGEL